MTFLDFCKRLAVSLTLAQHAFARVAFDGVQPSALGPAERELARVLFGEVRSIRSNVASVVVAVLGARSGKSLLCALRLLHLALTVDLSRLGPGEVGVGLIVAPDLRLARQTLRYVQGAIKSSPSLASLVVATTADSITIQRPDGRRVSIEALPATRGGSALRGRSLVGAVLDEAAFFLSDDGYTVNDAEVFKAVSPRVVRGGQTLIVSTPWARAGLLFDLHRENWGRPNTALAAHGATLLMRDNDATVAAVVERERNRDPGNALREYDAQFTDTSASLLSSEDVEACRERGVVVRPYRADVMYAMAVDVGLRNDSTVATVAHVENRNRPGDPPARVLVVDVLTILKPAPGKRVTIDEVEQAVATLATRYRIHAVHGDVHYADAMRPRLELRGLRYVEMPVAPSAQETRAKTLAAAFSARAVTLTDDETMAAQLKDLRVQRYAGGRVSVGASGSKHDDAADTLLLLAEVSKALPACGGDPGVVEFRLDGWHHDEQGVSARGARWVKVGADGRETMAGYPPWAPGAAEQYEEWAAEGIYTPESLEFFRRRDAGEVSAVPLMSVPIVH